MQEVTLFRLYLLRALYLLIVVGLGVYAWPHFFRHEQPWKLMESLETCMLLSFSALSIFGLRYPLQMIPLLLWELLWKIIWLVAIAMPLWLSGQMDESTRAVAAQIVLVVIIPFVIPWRYVFLHYVKKHGDRWRVLKTSVLVVNESRS